MSDDELLTQFLERHSTGLLLYARRCAFGDEGDAEDGVQECISKKWGKILEELRRDGFNTVPRWMWRDIHDRVLDVRRKRLRLGRGNAVRMTPTDPEKLGIGLEAECTESPDLINDWHARLLKAFEHCRPPLTKMEKNVLRLTILQEPPLSDPEAALSLDTTAETVKVRRCGGLRKLREFLNPDGTGRVTDLPGP